MIEEGYLKIDDYQLFYKYIKNEKNLNKPSLLFLHDSWGCTEMWDDSPEEMVNIFHLNALMYDRRGYGKSSHFSSEPRTKYYLHEAAEELIMVMDEIGINQAVLYGHSDGGTIALIAAALYPERIKALMVEGAHSFVEEKGKAAVRESRDKAKHNSLLQALERFHGDKAEELFRRWHEAWLGDFFAGWTIIPLLKNIQCPVLAFRGENDPFDTIDQLNALEREITSRLTVKVVPDAAHTPRKENAAETFNLIKNFCLTIKPIN